MANPAYQDPASPDFRLESLQVGTESGTPLIAEAVNPSASQAVCTNVTATFGSPVVVLAANSNRLAAILFNDSDRDCYVKLGSGADPTSFTYYMAAQTERLIPTRYVKDVTAVWQATVTGHMRVTELIPA